MAMENINRVLFTGFGPKNSLYWCVCSEDLTYAMPPPILSTTSRTGRAGRDLKRQVSGQTVREARQAFAAVIQLDIRQLGKQPVKVQCC